jgi:hypothetical protein
MATTSRRAPASAAPADDALGEILREIGVPRPILDEAKRRRDLVLAIAMEHEAARAAYVSGSVAHGTENKPLEDADGGVKVNRRFEAFRRFGPDAPDGGKGPEEFIQTFADYVLPRLRERGYPKATVDLTGNRPIKFEFNEPVDIDDWGPVDPYVDLIVGLTREAGGLWIPNRRRNWWDAADPEHHTWLMTERDEKPLRVLRAHVLRLAKRAVKRDDVVAGRTKVMCSWNLSALALEIVDETKPLSAALMEYFAEASAAISQGLTEDPSPAVDEPIKLPGVTTEMASLRLAEMAAVIEEARDALSPGGARIALQALYGDEIKEIRDRERKTINSGFDSRDAAKVASVLTVPAAANKITRSDGD